MERLTKHSKQTSHENGICCTHFYGPECLEVGGNCAMNCKWEEAAWSRLAAYEDTGLTPEQCENAKVIIESAFSDDTSKAERIRELLKADKAGRVVVLPCKVGDCDHCGAIKLAERYDCSFSYTLPYGWGEFGRNHLCPSCYTAWGNLKNQAESEGDNG